MIETKVPKDVLMYETRLLGPLTLRQIICLTISVVVDILLYTFIFTPLHLPFSYIVYILMFIDIPILIFIKKIRGVPMEQYLAMLIHDIFFMPAHRRYEDLDDLDEIGFDNKNKPILTAKERQQKRAALADAIAKNQDLKSYR